MCEAVQKWKERERKLSREAGRQEGRIEGRIEGMQLAKKIFRFYQDGISIEEIAKQCEISIEEVKEILE